MRTFAQTRPYYGACRVWPQAPSSLASSLLPQETYPPIHPCHPAALGGLGDDAIYSNNTPLHSQCTFQFINGFHLISQETRGRQGRVLTHSLSTDKVLCMLWFPPSYTAGNAEAWASLSRPGLFDLCSLFAAFNSPPPVLLLSSTPPLNFHSPYTLLHPSQILLQTNTTLIMVVWVWYLSMVVV